MTKTVETGVKISAIHDKLTFASLLGKHARDRKWALDQTNSIMDVIARSGFCNLELCEPWQEKDVARILIRDPLFIQHNFAKFEILTAEVVSPVCEKKLRAEEWFETLDQEKKEFVHLLWPGPPTA